MKRDPQKMRLKAGSRVPPRGRCLSCGTITDVYEKYWFHASRPRCPQCGDFLVPGVAHQAISPKGLQDRGMLSAAEKERRDYSRGTGRKNRHNCFIKGCSSTAIARFALCYHHDAALWKADRRLRFRIQGRYLVFHNNRWKVAPKALSMWNILVASASRKLNMTDPSSAE